MDLISACRLQLFDLGGVLIDVDARRTRDALLALGVPLGGAPLSNSHAAAGLLAHYCDGRISTPVFLEALRQSCKVPPSDEQLIEAWDAMLGHFRPEGLEAVAKARSDGHYVALLSNCNDLHTRRCREIFESERPGAGRFDDLFHAVFYSQVIGCSKPAPRAWRLPLALFGLQPDDCAFYDDSELNCHAAEALGLKTRRVTQ